ncbi:hypothetical protein M569_10310 [Genlisea aurea]|uniref:Uncharacterized protein n=1 Tax=Genlisea aurea TaxID=192259 RepID=S8DN97_9LAMI|nr:hypothetical protein M569_10310 [Genlisea aurea]
MTLPVEELVGKEREVQEKIMQKHSSVVEAYEKKSGNKEMESRVGAIDRKIAVLRQEIHDLLEVIEEI